jgi:hypothetical protein
VAAVLLFVLFFFFLVMVFPGVRTWAADIPVIGRYIAGVHSVLADPTQTTVIYTVEGDNPVSARIHTNNILFNGKQF